VRAHSCAPGLADAFPPGLADATPPGLAGATPPGLADATPLAEDSLPAAGEQDMQDQAMHSVTSAAPATLGPRRHFDIRTGRRFLPVSLDRRPGGSAITTSR